MFLRLFRSLDWVLTGLIVAVLGLGLATFYTMGPDAHGVFVRHATFIFLGILVMFAVSFFDYRIFKNHPLPSISLYILAVILLGLALASQEIRGSSAWLKFMGFQFEPSELAKLALLIVFAKYFSQKHVEIYNYKHLIVSGMYLAMPLGITLLQPDLGSVIVYVILWFSMLMAAGIKRKHLLALLMMGTVVASFGWFLVLKPYQRTRIVSFINPYLDPRGSGYNTIQSRITFGSGLWTGSYFSKRNETTQVVVPEPYTDFTFATYAQKFGLIGVILILTLLMLLLYRIVTIAFKADNNFAKLYGLGFAVILGTHILVNGGMNMGILPITGIPFPLVSHGGSFLLTLMAGFGILQNIQLRSTSN